MAKILSPEHGESYLGLRRGLAVMKNRPAGRRVKPARFATQKHSKAEDQIKGALHRAFTKLRPKVSEEVRRGLDHAHKGYDPNQPRDDRGRFGEGGSSGSTAPSRTVATAEKSLDRATMSDGKFWSSSVFKNDVEKVPEHEDHAPTHAVVTFSSIVPTQSKNSAEVTRAYIKDPSGASAQSIGPGAGSGAGSPIEVVKSGDRYYLTDGHHRAAAAGFRGQKNVSVLIVGTAKTSKIVKAAGDDEDAEWVLAGEIAERLDLGELAYVVDEVGSAQDIVAATAARETLGAIGIDGDRIVDQIDTEAASWAKDRSAELVGMRYDEDGNLVEAARASMRIDESTRDMVRQAIYDGLVDGKRSTEIADDIQSGAADTDYPFSEERAALIANTEIRRAHNQGSLIGIKAANDAGAKVLKEWITSGHETVCDDCQGNADQGPIDQDEDFQSGDDAAPAHPSCNCDIVAFVTEEPPQDEGEDDSEKLAREAFSKVSSELAIAKAELDAKNDALRKAESDLVVRSAEVLKLEGALEGERSGRRAVEFELNLLRERVKTDDKLSASISGSTKVIEGAVGAMAQAAETMSKMAQRAAAPVETSMTLKRQKDGSYHVVRVEAAK